ncbi:MAG: TolC family protein [Gammaproteobacteria bacterium]|nr:TolC family protein [Gammaproteobacteria bacterium]
MNSKFIKPIFTLLMTLAYSSVINAQQWTLQSSIAQAMTTSPELKISSAEIGARTSELELSGMWPDPSVELKVDNQMGRDEGTGDYGLSEITISQDIPLSRLKHQKSVAEAQLNAAMHSQSNETLVIQNRVAKVFYELQFATAAFELTHQRVKLADKLKASANNNKSDTLVRYLTPLEKMRLSIISEKAHQEEAAAEGKYRETLTEFYKLLGIDNNNKVNVPELLPVIDIPELDFLSDQQDRHPLLSTQQQILQAATNEIDVARNSAMRDPSISINKLRENFSSGTESVYGVMFNIEIPIHDRKSSKVSKANYNASQHRIELARLKRELQINLNQSYTHLNHVIEQTSEYKIKVLNPAKKILSLSEKGFISGELNILSLVDANNTYFESYMQYLDLMYQSWMEMADINLYAGQFIKFDNTQANINYTGVK